MIQFFNINYVYAKLQIVLKPNLFGILYAYCDYTAYICSCWPHIIFIQCANRSKIRTGNVSMLVKLLLQLLYINW